MAYPIRALKRSAAAGVVVSTSVVAVIVVVVVVLTGHTPSAAATFPCSGVHLQPGDDLDAIVNNDPADRATTFCVHASTSGTTYKINRTVRLKAGDKLIGQPGQVVTRGPASYGVPPVKIRNGSSVDKLVELVGPNVQLRWLDIAGAEAKYRRPGREIQGSGSGIRAGQANATARMEYLAIHHNDGQGIGSMRGKLLHSNLYENGTSRKFWGSTAAAVKGVDEFEAAHNYVHDNPAEGIWCDHRCSDAGPSMPNGFWVHDNLIVNNGRWGVRYEYSPIVKSGVHASKPSALVEDNAVHGNGYRQRGGFGGASMHDAQNATFRNNTFGPKSVAGVSYRANAGRVAVRFSDSGRRSRTDLWNGSAKGNFLGGESVDGCEKPDRVVSCEGNR
jgi:hypothetical protein